jgi:hypothetical protein
VSSFAGCITVPLILLREGVVNPAPICYCHVWNTPYHLLLNLFQRGSKFTSVYQGEDYASSSPFAPHDFRTRPTLRAPLAVGDTANPIQRSSEPTFNHGQCQVEADLHE